MVLETTTKIYALLDIPSMHWFNQYTVHIIDLSGYMAA